MTRRQFLAWAALPQGVDATARTLLLCRGLRAFCDGYVAVLLPAYLLALGMGAIEVGLISTLTLAGTAVVTIALGVWGHRAPQRLLLVGAALLMCATGLGFAGLSSFWPLALVAFVGTINPSAGDVSVFVPLEHAQLAQAARGEDTRTTLFARYTFIGSLCAALGALASAVPTLMTAHTELVLVDALRLMFWLYAAFALMVWWCYRRLPIAVAGQGAVATPLTVSRTVVWRLAALFSLDAFAGGLLVNSLLALWLFQRFDLSLAQAGLFFFWSGLATMGSQLLAPRLARRIGLLNTMVFTHIPANLLLIATAFAPSLSWALGLLLARGALSQMDVPARSAFVMMVVTPPERAAAASFTAVPRSLASALGPSLGAALLAGGWLAAPLLLCGGLKIIYDLALLNSFRNHHANL